ncbi:sugar phosphate isomerase/epimerase [Acrocarpospora macrocephala]|uniref:Sugar phosphate isomerase n=1 Tax=Acrocarpospora macrocephala TaxID=150177 RepID=A0A5M3WVM8_9ACTN|nr:sugar phosphate isomerase/epimerase [Acrocarpospora macrocephala]GES10198.1 sugar phosphate isomerase [Acrocarpospora macrocephala]
MTYHDLLATCWTTAGDAVPLPGRDASPIPLPARIEQAARAGFTGFGLMHIDLEEFLRTSDLPTVRKILDDNGIRHVELEFLTDWWLDDGERAESDRVLALLLEASEALAPHHVKIGPDIGGGPFDLDRYAAGFHRVCEAFAQAGTTVAVEFMPFSNINTLACAVELVTTAGHPAGGLMVDLWHVERGAATFEELARLPLGLVKGVELDDGAAQQVGDGYTDTVLRRRLCGQGDFRVVEFINLLRDLGWAGPWGVEILSETYRVLPLESAVPAAYATAARQFDAADGRA